MQPPVPTLPIQPAPPPTTGPGAIAHALSKINLEGLRHKHLDIIKSGAKSKRAKSVHALNAIEGLSRNNLTPDKLMISSVPVIPPSFRPFSVLGSTFVSGAANELYRDLFQYRDMYKETADLLGDKGAAQARLDLFDTARALYGYGEPIAPKTKQRGVAGFLKQITGAHAKESFVQRKLLSKTQDSVSRGTISVNPDLSLDEIGVPLSMAWVMYAPYIQRRLVQNGMSPSDALRNVKDRSDFARRALDQEVGKRPVIYSRAPSWHKFNVLAGKPKLIDGDTIAVNPLITTGAGADFDGDEVRNQLYACIPNEFVAEWTVQYKNLHLYKAMINNTSIPTIADHTSYIFDLEDFPHGELLQTKEGEKGQIDLHTIDKPIKVLAYDETTSSLKWAPAACWSKHYQREIEIVDTHNGYQLCTDDDPRAVYGAAAGTLKMERFTPSEALNKKVIIPRASRICNVDTTITSIPAVNSSSGSRVDSTVYLDNQFGYLVGAIVGDGWISQEVGKLKGVCLSDADGWNAAKVYNIIKLLSNDEINMGVKECVANTPGRYGRTVKYTFCSVNLAEFIKPLIGGVRDENTSGSANKHLPPFYLSAPEDFRLGLFAGLMDTDGSISVSNGKVKPQLMSNYGSTSLRLVQEVKLLAASLNITSRITPSNTPHGKPFWMLSLSNRDIQTWGGKYMVNKTKLDKLASIPYIEDSAVSAKYDIVPVSESLAKYIQRKIGCPKVTSSLRATGESLELTAKNATRALYLSLARCSNTAADGCGTTSRQSAKAVINRVGRDFVLQHPDGKTWLDIVDNTEITWERVTAVQKTGIKEDGYDLTVPGYETFMSADGIILSNTMNLHVPSMDEAVKEAYDKLLPSQMLFSIRDQEKVVPVPKQELILGLYTANMRPSKNTHQFDTEEDALSAIRSGKLSLSDDITIGKPTPAPTTTQPNALPDKLLQ